MTCNKTARNVAQKEWHALRDAPVPTGFSKVQLAKHNAAIVAAHAKFSSFRGSSSSAAVEDHEDSTDKRGSKRAKTTLAFSPLHLGGAGSAFGPVHQIDLSCTENFFNSDSDVRVVHPIPPLASLEFVAMKSPMFSTILTDANIANLTKRLEYEREMHTGTTHKVLAHGLRLEDLNKTLTADNQKLRLALEQEQLHYNR